MKLEASHHIIHAKSEVLGSWRDRPPAPTAAVALASVPGTKCVMGTDVPVLVTRPPISVRSGHGIVTRRTDKGVLGSHANMQTVHATAATAVLAYSTAVLLVPAVYFYVDGCMYNGCLLSC